MSKPNAGRAKFALLEHSTQRTCEISRTVTVGRENTDLVFANLTSLSRQHFEIVIDGDEAYIVDLGSSNGTKLNQEKLKPKKREPLQNGDSIIAGRVWFTFQIRGTPKNETLMPVDPNELKPEDESTPRISLVGLNSPKTWSKPAPEAYVPSQMSPQHAGGASAGASAYSSALPTHQWTTFLLALVLGAMAYSEVQDILAAAPGGPHLQKDLLLRYLFSVGLMYLSMVLLQFIFVLAFGRRWYLAILALPMSIASGIWIGDRLEMFAEYHKAEVENRVANHPQRTAKSEKTTSREERAPASK